MSPLEAGICIAQRHYDFWLDATSITVGRFRKWLHHLGFATFMAWPTEAIKTAAANTLLPSCIVLFIVGLVVHMSYYRWLYREARQRDLTDDADQRAGRHAAVNRRALASAHLVIVPVIANTLGAIVVYAVCRDAGLFVLWFTLVLTALNDCVMVRDRNTERFTLRKMAAQGT